MPERAILGSSAKLSTPALGPIVLKTRDRILEAARTLFNEEGVAAQSAVDIAAALGISPGHLYYHFRGKPEIVVALLEIYEAEIAVVLKAAQDDCAGTNATIETFWTHLH